jgi:hypothetical protein
MTILDAGHLSHVVSPASLQARTRARAECESSVQIQSAFSPERVWRILMQIIGLLCAASLTVQAMAFNFGHRRLFGFADQFNMNAEGNVPSWYSAFALLASAGLLSLVARTHHQCRLPYVRQWRALAFVFLLLSLDEACGFHEMMFFQASGRSVFHFAWVMAAIPMVAALGIAYLRLLAWLPPRTRVLFIISGCLFVGGALGMEMIDGWWASLRGTVNLGYALLTTLEEAMEMSGIALFIYAKLDYLRALQPPASKAFSTR